MEELKVKIKEEPLESLITIKEETFDNPAIRNISVNKVKVEVKEEKLDEVPEPSVIQVKHSVIQETLKVKEEPKEIQENSEEIRGKPIRIQEKSVKIKEESVKIQEKPVEIQEKLKSVLPRKIIYPNSAPGNQKVRILNFALPSPKTRTYVLVSAPPKTSTNSANQQNIITNSSQNIQNFSFLSSTNSNLPDITGKSLKKKDPVNHVMKFAEPGKVAKKITPNRTVTSLNDLYQMEMDVTPSDATPAKAEPTRRPIIIRNIGEILKHKV